MKGPFARNASFRDDSSTPDLYTVVKYTYHVAELAGNEDLSPSE